MIELQKDAYYDAYLRRTHLYGRLCLTLCLALFVAAPFAMGAVLGAPPDLRAFLKGIAQIAAVYIPSSTVEFLVYTPMLGAGGSYLAFITGNLINMKIPCAVNARAIVGAKAGTPENEIVSALSIATSALVTTAVIAIGVLLLLPLRPILESPLLQPAFENVVPALFGAMAYQYFRKDLKVVALPLLLMSVLCIAVPGLIPSVGFLIIPSGGLAILVAWLLHRKAARV